MKYNIGDKVKIVLDCDSILKESNDIIGTTGYIIDMTKFFSEMYCYKIQDSKNKLKHRWWFEFELELISENEFINLKQYV